MFSSQVSKVVLVYVQCSFHMILNMAVNSNSFCINAFRNKNIAVVLSLQQYIVQNVESFVVSAEEHRVPQHVNTVDWQGLLGDKTGRLHLVLHGLAGQPGRASRVEAAAAVHRGHVHAGRANAGPVPVPQLTTLQIGFKNRNHKSFSFKVFAITKK